MFIQFILALEISYIIFQLKNMILKNLCVAFLIVLIFSLFSESNSSSLASSKSIQQNKNNTDLLDLTESPKILKLPTFISSFFNSKKSNETYFESWPLDYIWAESNLKKQFTRMLITIIIYKKIAIFLALASLIFWIPVFTSSEGFFPSYAEEKEEESRSFEGNLVDSNYANILRILNIY